MIWNMIVHFHINPLKVDLDVKMESKLAPKEKILFYCKQITKGYPVQINNVNTDFIDGSILACLIHAKKPNLIDPKKIKQSKDNLSNLVEIIKILKHDFDVPHLIDPKDIIDHPEEKSMITFLSYVIQGLEKFPTVSFGLPDEENKQKMSVKNEIKKNVIESFFVFLISFFYFYFET